MAQVGVCAAACAEDIGNLKKYVSQSGVMLFFLSKMYFQSKNCLKEISASLEQEKPIVLVHESNELHGGAPLEALQAECPNEMRPKIFKGRTPIAWHRISHYQRLTIKLIATEMLAHSPQYIDEVGISGNDKWLVEPGAIEICKQLHKPLVLWCSPGNMSATSIAEELIEAIEATAASSGDGALGSTVPVRRQSLSRQSLSLLVRNVGIRRRGNLCGGRNTSYDIRLVDSQPDVQALEGNGESAAMLLYLNKDTWVEPSEREVLERDVRSAKSADSNLKIVMIHENDPDKGGCDFGNFFGCTPKALIDEEIYSDIAIALHTRPHRAVSLALFAQALGAAGDAKHAQRKQQKKPSMLSESSRAWRSSKGSLSIPGFPTAPDESGST